MKYLKTYESIFDFFKKKTKETDTKKIEIIEFCKIFKIKDYTINDDYTVDVDGNVNIDFGKKFTGEDLLTKIPIKFGRVTGNFSCRYNKLKSLENSPTWIGGNFLASNQYYGSLISLKGSPEFVKYGYYVNDNDKLKSLEHAPRSVYSINFDHTAVDSFDYLPEKYEKISFINTPLSNIASFFPGFKERSKSDEYTKYIELFREFDPIRPGEKPNDKPILLLDRFNDFLNELNPNSKKLLSIGVTSIMYDILSMHYTIE